VSQAGPRLTFFCELEPEPLAALFADGSVVETLVATAASVNLGLLDFGPERVAVARALNRAGVPVVGWLLLPQDEGYWFNMENGELAARRYAQFRAWTAEHDLRWDGIGIDLEPDQRAIRTILADRLALAPLLLNRLRDRATLDRANRQYHDLVATIHADGYRVDSYVIPFFIDERAAGSSLLHRLAGLVQVAVDREIPMLYTSFARPRGVAILWSYGRGMPAVAIGSTGGGVAIAGVDRVPPLSWDELARDLRLAHRLTSSIQIYSLEGCVRQGFLTRLPTFDWEGPVTAPADAATVDRLRAAARTVLRAIANPLPVLGSLALVWWLGTRFRH
jgi:hypothetical protein